MSDWTYTLKDGVERAEWSGEDFAGLRPHFHEQIQICLVLRGERRFWLRDGVVSLSGGEAICIPPGVLHAALAANTGFSCRNVYLDPSDGEMPAVSVARLGEIMTDGHAGALLDAFRHQGRTVSHVPMIEIAANREMRSVAALAKSHRQSREHFSRSFKTRTGISPRSAILARKVNYARALLRCGLSPSEAAFEAAFADQSHLTRHFRSFFGTTPGAYARGLNPDR